jgi:plasmid stabilization system protein ParE
VARVLVAPAAADDLARMIATHSLPVDTPARVGRSIEPLGQFPLLGAPLAGRWRDYRFILGPWRWMVIVYAYDAGTDIVAILTIQDGRTSAAATTAQ